MSINVNKPTSNTFSFKIKRNKMENGEDSVDLNQSENFRLADYKCRSSQSTQEARRLQLLQEQKRRRDECYDCTRNVAEIFANEDEDEDKEADYVVECMDWKSEKPKHPRLKDMFMLSEWMIKQPDDLETKWVFLVCPVGKRCLVRSCKGCTTVYSKKGHHLARFQSLLPNGSFRDYSGTKYHNSDVTLLDCIWNSQMKTYYILDVLCWKDQSYLDTDMSFRCFWIRSKINEENPCLLERSAKNPYPFIPLEPYSCELSTISSVMLKYPHFENDQPKIDGILFYHMDAHYTPGVTPLVVWLKPFMIPEVLGSSVFIADEYYQFKPKDYVDMSNHIAKYEEKQQKLAKVRKARRRKINQPDDEMDDNHVLNEEEEMSD